MSIQCARFSSSRVKCTINHWSFVSAVVTWPHITLAWLMHCMNRAKARARERTWFESKYRTRNSIFRHNFFLVSFSVPLRLTFLLSDRFYLLCFWWKNEWKSFLNAKTILISFNYGIVSCRPQPDNFPLRLTAIANGKWTICVGWNSQVMRIALRVTSDAMPNTKWFYKAFCVIHIVSVFFYFTFSFHFLFCLEKRHRLCNECLPRSHIAKLYRKHFTFHGRRQLNTKAQCTFDWNLLFFSIFAWRNGVVWLWTSWAQFCFNYIPREKVNNFLRLFCFNSFKIERKLPFCFRSISFEALKHSQNTRTITIATTNNDFFSASLFFAIPSLPQFQLLNLHLELESVVRTCARSHILSPLATWSCII